MARAFKDTPWPILLLVASFLCPTELSVYIGSARLPPHRALLLLLLPVALLAIVGRRGIRPRAFDAAFLGFALWTLFVYIHHHGHADGLQTGGALALDGFGSYIVARAFVRDARAFSASAATLLAAVVVAGLLALPDMLLGQIVIHDALRHLTGYEHPVGIEKRLGLTRAFGTFDHPIHLGTFCASGLALAVYAARRETSAVARGIIVAASALTSLSAAPMLSLIVQASAIGFEKLTRGIKGRVTMAVVAIGLAFAALSLVATRSPFHILATTFTFDSWTGYYRLMIWENGLANVWHHPIVGLGLNDWERPVWMVSSTVDAFWLVIAMRTGLPALLLLVLGLGLVIGSIAAAMRRRLDRDARRLGTGWMISLLALVLVGFTVHYWNVPFAYFFFFVGLGAWMADPATAARPAHVQRKSDAAPPQIEWLRPDAVAAGHFGRTPLPAGFAQPAWPVPVKIEPQRGNPPS